MNVSHLQVDDYFNLANALTGGNEVSASVSFRIRWSGVTNRFSVRDTTNQFRGNFVVNTATAEWEGSNANGFSFKSDPASTSINEFSLLGRERNGAFFPPEPDANGNNGDNGDNGGSSSG